MHAGIIKLPDVPMVVLCDEEHLDQRTPDDTRTYREVREQFILDVASMQGRTLMEVVRVVEKMRTAVTSYPNEFTDEAELFINRLHANAVAQRLLGNLEAGDGEHVRVPQLQSPRTRRQPRKTK